MPVFLNKGQIRPDSQGGNIMGIKMEDLLLRIIPDETDGEAALQGQDDADRIFRLPIKGQQTGTEEGAAFRQEAQGSAEVF